MVRNEGRHKTAVRAPAATAMMPAKEAALQRLLPALRQGRSVLSGAPMMESMLRSGVAAYVNGDQPMERRDLVRKTFANGRPGRKWLSLFIGRHPEVARVHGRTLQEVRAAASNPDNMTRMCTLLKQVREEK